MLQPLTDESSDASVVELRMPNKRGSYMAGQWVYLCVPRLGLLHWHPFTISSGGNDKELTLHVGTGGRWTNRLAQLVANESKVKVRVARQLSSHASLLRSCSRLVCRSSTEASHGSIARA